MGMFGGGDSDEKYDDYLKDGSMFGKMDRSEWEQRERRAQEIASGEVMGTFERDEKIWERVKEIQEGKK